MRYQKVINLLENTPNQPYKLRTKNWVEINDDTRGTYNKNNQIKFKTSMLNSSLFDYIDAYIVKGEAIKIDGEGTDDNAKQLHERNKGVIFKNCAPFTNCLSEINNTQIDNAKDIDVVMLMYNLIEYSVNYSKTPGSLWQYYRDDPNENIMECESFKFKIDITGKTLAAGKIYKLC